MHRLGTSVLMVIILPLAFSCESGHNKTLITDDYRNIIRIQLKHVEAIIEQLDSNCTVRNVSMAKEPKNYSADLLCKCSDLPFPLIPYPYEVHGQLGAVQQHTDTDTQSIHRKICRVNVKLRRNERNLENVNGHLKDVLYKLAEEINTSLRCWCHGKREGTNKPIQQTRKWKLCRVKDILANLQRHFEQYNAYLSLSTDLPERGKTSEQTGI